MTTPVHNTKTIARNSLWYGLEVGIALVAAFGVSVTAARAFGPEKLGYYAYITWLTNISAQVGCFGIPMSTRKFMAEYLGRGDGGTARVIFFVTLRLQIIVSAAITLAGLALVLFLGDPSYRLISVFLVAGLFPRMAVLVTSQANMARENLRANVPASLANNIVTIAIVVVTLVRGWGLLGYAVAMFVGHWAEFFMRTIPCLIWVKGLPEGNLPRELRSRMVSFSGYGMILMLLNTIVWDRSDIIFLKALSPDIRQVSFFSIVFNLSEKILLIPQTFGHAIGASVMVQYGRDEKKLVPLVSTAGRYIFLLAVPLLLGAATMSNSLIRLVYGKAYLPAIPIMAVVCVLAIPKSLLLPAQHLLQTLERQKFLVIWGLLCAVINVSLDILLIPKQGAMGAAIANGVTQLVAMLGIWVYALKLYPLDLRFSSLGKILLSGGAMAAVVFFLDRYLPSRAALACDPICGALTFGIMLRITGSLEPSDRERLQLLRRYAPRRLSGSFDRALRFLVPTTAAASEGEN